jgi:uncharacterized hydrophobic protein (TIGR00341 family)
MPLRQIQLTLKSELRERLDEFITEHELEPLWASTAGEDHDIVFLLIQAYEADELINELVDDFGKNDDLRVTVFEALATHPHPEDTDCNDDINESVEDECEEDDEKESKGSRRRVMIEELEETLRHTADISHIYLITVFLSSLVAVLGLWRDNTAVVIGAMVIAPLLGPNMALALGSTLGSISLVRRSLITLGTGIALSFTFALVLGMIFTIDPEVSEIASRAQVHFTDIILALAVGVAGALSFTTGVSASLVGVMVAVALLPPLVCCGLLLGAGYWHAGMMAAILTGINIMGINLAGVATFTLSGVKPRYYYEEENASKMTRRSLVLWSLALVFFIALVALVRSAIQWSDYSRLAW